MSSTATPVVPGWLQSGICPVGETTCWVPATPLSQFQALTFTFSAVGSPGTLSASTTSSNLALPANGAIVEIANGGSVAVYVNLGVGSGLTATTSNMLVGPGQTIFLPVETSTYIAGITASSTASVTVTVGNPAAAASSGGPVNATIVGPLGPKTAANSVAVLPPFSRVAAATTTFTPATTGYTAGQNIGGALSLAGGVGNSTPIRVRSVTVAWTTASTSANGGIDVVLLSAAPASTIADGSVPTWIAADAAKYNETLAISSVLAATSTGLFFGTTTGATVNPALAILTTTDTSGNINLVFLDGGAITYTTPTTATVRVVFEY